MNAQPVINREESGDGLAQLRSEIAALKDAVALMAQHVETGTRASRSENFVHKDEFRLFKWIGGLALASILGGFGFLYQGLADLRVAVERQHGELRSEMEQQYGELRSEMERQNGELRSEMERQNGGLRSEMERQHGELRSEMERQNGELRSDMDRQIGELRSDMDRQFADVRERLVRVETLVRSESPVETTKVPLVR